MAVRINDRDRSNPAPLGQGWELPFIVISGVVIGAALTALAGMAAAAAVAGGGWVWPAGTQHMLRVLGGLASGHPGAGLSVAEAGRLPGPGWVYTGVAVAELMFLTLAGAAGMLAWRYRRPASGMATRAEAADALGVAQLASAKTIIRPDLYRARGKHGGRQ
jgi:hypothetical protein